MGKASRDKGMRGEQEVVRILMANGYPYARRTAGLQAYSGLIKAPDVDGTGDMYVEVKREETLKLPAYIRQVEKDCPPNKIPTITFRRSRMEWWIAQPLTDYLQHQMGDWPNGGESE